MNNLAAALLAATEERPVRLVYGTATAANTVAVRGAATPVELPAVTPVLAGDYCAVLEAGADRLIIGPVDRPPLFTGFKAANGTGYTVNPNDVGNAFHNYGGGNAVTSPTGTSALVIVGGRVRVGTANKNVRFGVAVSGATTLAAADARAWASGNMSATGTDHAGSRVVLLTGLTPGSNTFTVFTKGEGGSYSMTVGETNIAVFALA